MFTNQYYIRLVNGTINNGSLISQNLTNSVALDFHWETGCIYWSDVTAIGSSIKRSCTITNKSEDIGKVEMKEEVKGLKICVPQQLISTLYIFVCRCCIIQFLILMELPLIGSH